MTLLFYLLRYQITVQLTFDIRVDGMLGGEPRKVRLAYTAGATTGVVKKITAIMFVLNNCHHLTCPAMTF